MPRYFLDLENGDERYFDDVGCYAADECEVLSALVEIISEYRGTRTHPGVNTHFRVSIIDTSGQTVASLTM